MTKKTFKIDSAEKQLEFCMRTNCLGCNLNPGSYEDCPHLDNKTKALEAQSSRGK